MAPRHDWHQRADEAGFYFHTFDDGPYWDESAAFEFTLKEIEEDIEDVTDELNAMAVDFVSDAVECERTLASLHIPEAMWSVVRDSWHRTESAVYGRMDLVYDGRGPAKLLEFNADTPTSCFEAGHFQWGWMEDQADRGVIPKDSDQFNSLHEKLVAGFGKLHIPSGELLYLCSVKNNPEDEATVEYLRDCAYQSGCQVRQIYIEDIGADENGQLNDLEDNPIRWLFKLYPWEEIFHEEYARYLLSNDTNFIEPAWKSILSNKGMLPHLWARHPGHPNLVPAYFEEDPQAEKLGDSYARKPIFAREGENVSLFKRGVVIDEKGGLYGEEGYVRQQLIDIPNFGHGHVVLGSWIADNQACGMGIREDCGPITTDDARFIPHYIVD